MSTLLLVHGGWCSSWVWDRLLPELNGLEVPFKTVDLPGHGLVRKPIWSISMRSYAKCVSDAADAIDGRVIAVGHSAGGFAITAAAGYSPEAFDELVYLAGFVPEKGERLIQLSLGDKKSKLGPGVRPNPIKGRVSLHPRVWSEALFHDCAEEEEQEFAQRVESEPLRPGLSKLSLKEGFAEVPKHYILCTEDKAITPEYQRWMARRSNVQISHELQCGHMPMLAKPKELARTLAQYVRSEHG
ncbi:MAG: alpha/beta hydrolase [Pseudomonadota bacterium]